MPNPNYRVNEKNYRERTSVWKAQLEALVILAAIQISAARPEKGTPQKICQELNAAYVRKTEHGSPSLSKLQREILANQGS